MSSWYSELEAAIDDAVRPIDFMRVFDPIGAMDNGRRAREIIYGLSCKQAKNLEKFDVKAKHRRFILKVVKEHKRMKPAVREAVFNSLGGYKKFLKSVLK